MNQKKRHLIKAIPLFALWGVVAYLGSDLIFLSVTNVPSEKRFSLFLAMKNVDSPALKQRIESYALPGIEEVNVYAFDPQASNYDEMFSLLGLRESSCFVLPASMGEKNLAYFAPLPREEMVVRFPNVEPFVSSSSVYGVKVFDEEKQSGVWTKEVTYPAEDCYCYFRKGKNGVGEVVDFSKDIVVLSFLERICG